MERRKWEPQGCWGHRAWRGAVLAGEGFLHKLVLMASPAEGPGSEIKVAGTARAKVW